MLGHISDPGNRLFISTRACGQRLSGGVLGEEKGLAILRQSRHQSLEIWEGATKVFPVSTLSAAADDS